ncbi:Asp-tRNA(Asn)/Glu-tRNA(Gln) amidotransferase subunit GatA [Alkaliphilus sp. MSJ-5]|uniref:Glutamyl-tRNA(Gln) amidotransferase subunit A n=1 Tax=Alkaliphilus flagellatus TaxID=2841507 RepID=A0ABS6G6M7_9FIRM|nr:Asp-tRNA(Asn)/Glu-tRNA(Gln) amidotransferase subunit GatA [Alkaliphilus flagellatus]MBU5678029.1 Asp-tRNA(Asn)/Glu-tRNA(Gln) amidotransferase subunit GatA [Alkaliphilus flagellatus]
MELYNLSMYEIKNKIEKKEIKAVEVLESTLKRIDSVEDKVQSYLTLTEDIAFCKANEIDKKIANNKAIGELGGIPMAIKDNICTEEILTTCASKMLHNFIPPYSATVYEKLLMEDGVMLGKTNMDEFAMGSSTENSFYKTTKNPWDISKVPGGSSGGSASAVAAGEAFFALGSDTGGSIRQPAAFCGVVGLKPTYGLVSRYGLVAMANSLDHIGPITKDVTDCALVLNAITGYDSKDGTSIKRDKIDYLKTLNEGIKGLRIAIPREYFDENLSEPVRKALIEAIQVFENLGAVCEEVSLPNTKYAMAVYYIISQSEVSLALARFDGIRYGHRALNYTNIEELVKYTRSEGFGPEVKRRIVLGTHWLSGDKYKEYYQKANEVRKLIKLDFNNIFSNYDVVLMPTSATTAFELGSSQEKPLAREKLDGYTVAANLAGIPAISIPCGFDKGLPIGMQLMGKDFDEETLLRVARAFERNTSLNHKLSL